MKKPVDLLNLSLKSRKSKKVGDPLAVSSGPATLSTSTRKASGDSNEFASSLKAVKEKIKAPKIVKRYTASIDSRREDLNAPPDPSDEDEEL